MRLLADENIPRATITILRELGHDVLAAGESMLRAPDREVLRRAGSENRLLLTFDRDFSALAFRSEVPAPAGIILCRFVPVNPEEPATILSDILTDAAVVFEGKFTVVDRERVRQRNLPGGGAGDPAT